MKNLSVLCSIPLAAYFIAIPITDQDSGAAYDQTHRKSSDSAPNESSPHRPNRNERPVANSPVEQFESAIPDHQLHNIVNLCVNYCDLVDQCQVDSDENRHAGSNASFSHPNEERRPISDFATDRPTVEMLASYPTCTGNDWAYKVFDQKLLESAKTCKEGAFVELSSIYSGTQLFRTENDCCQTCIMDMDRQYRLASECGEKLKRLMRCLVSSNSCLKWEKFNDSSRKKVRQDDDPDYPCRECVEAFGFSCGKG